MQTKKVNVVEDYHGTPVADPYRWLEDSGDPEVQVWVERQNALTEAFLQGEDPRPAIKARLQELWNYPRTQLPRRAGSWIFLKRTAASRTSRCSTANGASAVSRRWFWTPTAGAQMELWP